MVLVAGNGQSTTTGVGPALDVALNQPAHWYEKLWGTGAGAGIEWTQVRIQPRWNGVIELTIFLGLQGSDSAQDTTLGNTISHAIEATVSALANRFRLAEPLCLAWTLIL